MIGALLIILVFSILCKSVQSAPRNVLDALVGIDLGDEFTKVAYYTRGKQIQILLNPQSGRKFLSAISFSASARVYSDETAHYNTDEPSQTFQFTNSFLGFNITQNSILHNENGPNGLPANMYPNKYDEDHERGSIKLVANNLRLYPEDITANLLSFIKSITRRTLGDDDDNGQEISMKAVVAIRCSFNQRQRIALKDAAEIAGINLIGLVHQTSAAAVQYSLSLKKFNSSQIVLFYDIGSKSVDLSAFKFSAENPSKPVNVQMLACASVNDAGSHYINLSLVNYMLKKFREVYNVDLSNDSRAIKQILAHAEKIKQDLSASKSISITISDIHQLGTGDIVFELSRDILNQLIEETGIVSKLISPLDSVLKQSNLTLSDIHSVQMLGGGSRILRVMEEIQKNLGNVPINRNLNIEEAPATGAAIIATNSSTSVKIKPIILTDVSVYNYRTEIIPVKNVESSNNTIMGKFSDLVLAGSKLQGIKTIKFTSDHDVDLKIYENQNLITSYQIRGISTACEKFESEELPNIILGIFIDNLGIIKLSKAIAKCKEKILTTSTTTTINIKDSNNTNTTQSENIKSESEAPKLKLHNVLLNFTEIYQQPLPMSNEDKSRSIKIMHELDELDKTVLRSSDLRNDIESVIDRIYDCLEDQSISGVTTAEQREELMNLTVVSREWLENNGRNSTISVLEGQLKQLNDLYNPISYRITEFDLRPKLITQLETILGEATNQIEEYKVERQWIPETIMNNFSKFLNDTTSWLNDTISEQNNLPDTVEPIFRSSDVYAKLHLIRTEMRSLSKIPRPRITTPSPSLKSNTPMNDTKTNETKSSNTTSISTPTIITSEEFRNSTASPIVNNSTSPDIESNDTSKPQQSNDEL